MDINSLIAGAITGVIMGFVIGVMAFNSSSQPLPTPSELAIYERMAGIIAISKGNCK